MGVGDVKALISSIGISGFMDIRPAAGEEWNLRAIVYEDEISIEFWDGTNHLIFEASLTGSGIYYMHFDITNTHRVQVQNKAGAPKLIGYTARQVK